MENIGDYLYLILVLALGLLGALRKKRVNKTVTQPVPDDDGQEEFYPDDTVRNEQGGRGVEIEADNDFWKEILVDENSTDKTIQTLFDGANEGKYVEPLASDFSDEGVSALTVENRRIDSEISEKEEINSEFSEIPVEESIASRIANDFNLHEAIVYSEILNRKEHF